METLFSTQGRQVAFHIGEPSEIATARRAACDLARSLGFNETVTGKVAIVITEAGTNITKYAGSGEILLRKAVRHDGAVGIEILALDKGPGIAHLSRFMQDGHTTGASYGIGLGTMARLADQFDIYTAFEQGTVICLSFWCKPDARFASECDIGIVCLPVAGETICGDAWPVLLADGAGRGQLTAMSFKALLQAEGEGAAPGVAGLDIDAAGMTCAGVGDIAGCILDDGKIYPLVCRGGILGSALRREQASGRPWSSNAVLVMHTDCIRTGWDLARYPGLALSSPALIAAVLYRDFSRGNDDATVLVCRQAGGQAGAQSGAQAGVQHDERQAS
jgi:anti-sigma regulatory factor (Ser/Thr protein kinase)